MVYGPAVLRCTAALELACCKNLDGLTAILGCALCMPQQSLLDTHQLARLPPEQLTVLCLSLWHAVNWLREVVNAFAADEAG